MANNNNQNKCRFGRTCFDISGCKLTHEAGICTDVSRCEDFHCPNRHIKTRKRPCAAGGDCKTKATDCSFLHPEMATETIKCIKTLYIKEYLMHLVKTFKCTFTINDGYITISSNRGKTHVKQLADDITNNQFFYIKYNDISKYSTFKLKLGCTPDLFKCINNSSSGFYEKVQVMLSKYFGQNGYQHIRFVILDRVSFAVNSNRFNIPTMEAFIEHMSKLNCIKLDNVDESMIKPLDKDTYVILPCGDGTCCIFTFNNIHEDHVQRELYNIRDNLFANYVECDKHVIDYLNDFSETYQVFINDRVRWIKEKRNTIEPTKYVRPDGRTDILYLIKYYVDKIHTQKYAHVYDAKLFAEALRSKFGKIIVEVVDDGMIVAVGNNIQQTVDNFIMDNKANPITYVKVCHAYSSLLLKYPKLQKADNCHVVVSHGKIIIISHKKECLKMTKKRFRDISKHIKEFAKTSETHIFTEDEYYGKYNKYAVWASEKNGAYVYRDLSKDPIIEFNFIGSANNEIRANEDFKKCIDMKKHIRLASWLLSKKSIKDQAKKLCVDISSDVYSVSDSFVILEITCIGIQEDVDELLSRITY